ncbi:galactoside O-acetyltransferase [Vibrio sp. JCM 19236]|nr:galactoside O-acetyltransferase [Vibrio sp. JCM 19236]
MALKFLRSIGSKIKFRHKAIISLSSSVSSNSVFEGMNKLYPNCIFDGELGKGTYIGPRSEIYGKVGRFTSIGPDVKVIKGTHPYTFPFASTSPVFYSVVKQNGYSFTNKQLFNETLSMAENGDYSVIIGNDCWIGDRVIILGGVTIGDGAVILAGAIVTKDVEPYAIVGGLPAKPLKFRYDKLTIKQLLDFKWWNKSENWLQENIHLMNNLKEMKREIF